MADQRDGLRNVFWIGGATCAGKSTAADELSQRHGTQVYHFDRREPFHIYRSVPEEQPSLIRFMSRTMDERWVTVSPEAMLEDVIAGWTERFPMVVDDLQRMVQDGPVIAEGAGFFPPLVRPWMVGANGAWLIPTPEFQRRVRTTRERSVADSPHISDPKRAFENLVARDALLARYVRDQATAHNMPMLDIDEDTVAGSAEWLDPHIRNWLDELA